MNGKATWALLVILALAILWGWYVGKGHSEAMSQCQKDHTFDVCLYSLR